MNHLSLFSGIGGLDLAAEAAGFRTVAFVERDSYCQRVLRKHWPDVPIFGDVCEFGVGSVERADIISGGFPCQPHSVAGKRQASGDERDLWDECARITSEFKPRWAVFENVPGLLSSERGSFFARVLDDLASLGYRVGWGVWGAVDVGAPHRRDRIFIVAHSKYNGQQRSRAEQAKGQNTTSGGGETMAHSASVGQSGQGEPIQRRGSEEDGERKADFPISMCGRSIWSVEPGLGRVVARVPNRVDRLRALGNAVVPQQAYPIFKAIAEIEGL